MKSEDRRKQIIDHLMETGTDTVDAMAVLFAVSRMTIHRDLDQLESDGLLRKVRGGASVQSTTRFESDFQYRKRLAAEEKRRIAAAAADMVEPGQTVILDDGSTVAAMLEFLVDKAPLTVISNNAAVIQTLMGVSGVTLLALGGQYNKRFHGFFGLATEEALHQLRADLAFLSTSSVSGANAFHQDHEIVKSKRAIIDAADKRYLLLDHTKFDRTALHLLSPMTAFDGVVTGQSPSTTACTALRDAGVTLILADDIGRKGGRR